MNNAIVINKNASFTGSSFLLKFVGIAFVSSSNAFITSSQIIAQSSIILANYFPFSQPHIAGIQT